jgi:hypothetical protein
MSSCRPSRDIDWRRHVRIALIVASAALAWPVIARTLPPDLCGCRSSGTSRLDTRPVRGRRASTVSATTLPLPPDGVLVFVACISNG